METKIDLEQFICSLIEAHPDFKKNGSFPCMYYQALKDQGLEYKDGKIVNIEPTPESFKIKDEKPKFKVGDWITNDACILKITAIEDCIYRFDEGDGMSTWFVDNNYHLWTIQDAKDGDVLVTNSNIIFIFKFLDEGGTIAFRASCTKNSGVYFPKIKERLCDQDVHPATKEQRDLLFAKIHEAGYLWNSKNKQLLCLKAEPDKVQPAEWSKKDDKIIETSISFLKEFKKAGYENAVEGIDWLKSLKEKVQPQPKQEWSEEDETHRHWILEMLKDGEIKTPEFADHFKAAFNWLKSLRPQNRWKPSEEQMKVLLSEVEGWTKGCPKQIVLESLYNDLKKLKA